MQKVFEITNKYIVLATPLIIYILLSSVYAFVSINSGKLPIMFFAIILSFIMFIAFLSGWFNMIKYAVIDTEDEDPNMLIKEFPTGIGEYFLPVSGAFLTILFISTLAFASTYFIGANLIGDPEISSQALANAMQNTTALKSFLTTLSVEQLTKISQWNMLILGTSTFLYFLLLLYMPALFFKNKNPFIAIFISLKDLFSKKIFKTIGVFLIIFIVNFILSLLSTLLGNNAIIHFALTILNFYFITAAAVGIFYYYNQNFVQNSLGQNIDIKI